MASDWTDELREQVIEEYTAAEPTSENSMEVVKEIADKLGKTPNGVRMVLTRAQVYVKKEPTASTSTSESKTPRVSKADAIQALTDVIESAGLEADEAILSKLTGKAAVYLTSIFNSIKGD